MTHAEKTRIAVANACEVGLLFEDAHNQVMAVSRMPLDAEVAAKGIAWARRDLRLCLRKLDELEEVLTELRMEPVDGPR
jgi:hypothetical protein